MKTRLTLPNAFVNISARLVSPYSLNINITPLATYYLVLWYTIELCFFLIFDDPYEALKYTPSLAQKTIAGPSKGMPTIRSLYLNDINFSAAILSTTNSLEKVLLSTVFCLLENQNIDAIFK